MRVLGVDPGLTRCGIGIVDVAADRRATLVYVGVVQRRRRWRSSSGCSPIARGHPRRCSTSTVRRDGGRAGVRAAQPAHRDGNRPGQRHRPRLGRRARVGRRAAHAERGQGRDHRIRLGARRRRSARWWRGCSGCDAAEARRCGRRAGPRDLSCVEVRRLPRRVLGRRETPAQRAWREAEKRAVVGWRMISSRARNRAHRRRHSRRHRGRRSRPRGPGHAAARADAARRPGGHAAHRADRARRRLSLFGFATPKSSRSSTFCAASRGSGPSRRSGVLATLSPVQVAQAVAAEDDAPFRKVSGIGPKTAKLIAVSLAGKLIVPTGAAAAPRSAPPRPSRSVVGALVGLGWNDASRRRPPRRRSTRRRQTTERGAGLAAAVSRRGSGRSAPANS